MKDKDISKIQMVAPTVFINVLVVNCSNGEYQKYDENNKKLFAWTIHNENKNMQNT